MHYQQLMIVATLATFAALSTAAAAGVMAAWPVLESRIGELPARLRARCLYLLRLTPVLVGVTASIICLVAFLRYEPRGTTEAPGWILMVGAVVGAALVVTSVGRIVARSWATLTFLRDVEGRGAKVAFPGVSVPAWELESAFPLMALAGVWRPRLLVARCVLERVPEAELQVMLQHEIAHARRRDNLWLLLLTALPDVLNLAGRRHPIEQAWRNAAEDVADDIATGPDVAARTHLAAAVIRVAKMVGRQSAPAGPLLAFHRGDCIERRVRRLLEPPAPVPMLTTLTLNAVAVLAVASGLALWLNAEAVLRGVHEATEWLVNGSG